RKTVWPERRFSSPRNFPGPQRMISLPAPSRIATSPSRIATSGYAASPTLNSASPLRAVRSSPTSASAASWEAESEGSVAFDTRRAYPRAVSLRRAGVLRCRLAGRRIEDVRRRVRRRTEVEHAAEVEPDALVPVERIEDLVERPFDPRQPPVVLDEVDDRGLVAEVAVDVVRLRPGRDHELRQPRPEAAASLLPGERTVAVSLFAFRVVPARRGAHSRGSMVGDVERRVREVVCHRM